MKISLFSNRMNVLRSLLLLAALIGALSTPLTQIGHQRPGVAGGSGAKPGLPVTHATAQAADIAAQIKLATVEGHR